MLCPRCRRELRNPPELVSTRIDPHVPVFALSPYGGAHRSVILAMKEKNNFAVRPHIGAVVDSAIKNLQARGHVPEKLVLVPAPTQTRSATARGGDPVTDICRGSTWPTAAILRTRAGTRDQTQLDAGGRRKNLLGRVVLREGRLPSAPVLLIDDVVTTGSTLAASSERLLAAGVQVAGALVLAYA